MTLKPKKCRLFQKSVNFLGHIVSPEGVSCDPEKVADVRDWPTPESQTDVRSFLGLASYYRRFIPNFATVANPMTKLTGKDEDFRWTLQCQDAFDALKGCLMKAPILSYPFETGKYILDTDASGSGVGAVLSQEQDGKEKVIAYASRTLSKTQRNYCTTQRELLAVVTFVKHFRHYLLGRNFLIRTDHASLRWLINFKEPEGMVARWLSTLSTYDYDIEHRVGRSHGNADGLSRRPPKKCKREDCPDCKKPQRTAMYSLRSSKQRGMLAQAHPPTSTKRCAKENSTVEGKSADIHTLRSADGVPAETLVSQPAGSPAPNVNHGQRGTSDGAGSGATASADTSWISGWSQEELKRMQTEYSPVGKALGWMTQGSKPAWAEIAHEGQEVKSLWNQWKHLEIRDGLLYRHWTHEGLGSHSVYQLIAPKAIQKEIRNRYMTTGWQDTLVTIKRMPM